MVYYIRKKTQFENTVFKHKNYQFKILYFLRLPQSTSFTAKQFRIFINNL